MASGLLITAVLFFAVRGMFLGISGVIGRLAGFALGYVVAYRFRHQLAAFVSQNTGINLPDVALQMMSGLVLFVSTMFITGLLVNGLFKLLGKSIPGFDAMADRNSIGSKVAGATANGCIAAAIVLMGIWGYGKVTGSQQPEDRLQQFANRFGDQVFTAVSDNTDLDLDIDFQSFSSTSTSSVQRTVNQQTNTVSTTTGSAYIVSSSNPEKSLSIETVRQAIEQKTGLKADASGNYSNEQLQSLANNPELRDMAMRQLQDNPEQLQQLLNNPKLMEFLEQFNTSKP
jgi:uncharacterized membrane protein required for colicin V production